MRIRVVVPDAFAASDLTWHLNASALVSGMHEIDGRYVVYVETDKEPHHVVDEIRKWTTLTSIAPVTVHLGDDQRNQLSLS
jgi:hypothetical protein